MPWRFGEICQCPADPKAKFHLSHASKPTKICLLDAIVSAAYLWDFICRYWL